MAAATAIVATLKKVHVRFNPWEESSKWGKEIYRLMKTRKNADANPKCEFVLETVQTTDAPSALFVFSKSHFYEPNFPR